MACWLIWLPLPPRLSQVTLGWLRLVSVGVVGWSVGFGWLDGWFWSGLVSAVRFWLALVASARGLLVDLAPAEAVPSHAWLVSVGRSVLVGVSVAFGLCWLVGWFWLVSVGWFRLVLVGWFWSDFVGVGRFLLVLVGSSRALLVGQSVGFGYFWLACRLISVGAG